MQSKIFSKETFFTATKLSSKPQELTLKPQDFSLKAQELSEKPQELFLAILKCIVSDKC